MSKPAEYGICIRLIRQDEADLYEGRVRELPDLKVYCESHCEAYEEIIDAIGTAQEMFADQGRAFPDATPSDERFSGRVTLRMSKSLHRLVHEQAALDDAVLNQWIVEAMWRRLKGATLAPVSYVMSPARRGNVGAPAICIQQAAHIQTGQSNAGTAIHFLYTPAVTDHVSTLASYETFQRVTV